MRLRNRVAWIFQALPRGATVKSTRSDHVEAITSQLIIEDSTDLAEQIRHLQNELTDKTADYNSELQRVQQLRQKFEDIADSLEFEQMAFQKREKEMRETLDEDKTKIRALEFKLKTTQESYETTKSDLLAAIQQERLAQNPPSLEETKSSLAKARQEHMESLKEKEEGVKNSERELARERETLGVEQEEWRKKLEVEREYAHQTLESYQEDKKLFEAARRQQEADLVHEEDAVQSLQDQLEQAHQILEEERQECERTLTEETERLSRMDDGNRTSQYVTTKNQLKEQLAREIQAGRLKKKQMHDKYKEIRTEMTTLWEASKREARQEQALLRSNYEQSMEDVQQRVARLQVDLQEWKTSADELRSKLDKAELEKQGLLKGQREVHGSRQNTLAEHDVVINELNQDIAGVQREIDRKDALIKDQQEQIMRLESSFRELATLSLQLTGEKLRRVGGSFLRLLQNFPPEELD